MTARLLLAAALLPLAACGDADAPPPVHTGTLEVGDDTLISGEYMDTYDVVAREGQWIRAELVSGDFDPYIMVLSPTDVQTDVDDSSAGNTSMTKAVVEATEGGRWTLVVTSFAPGESGDYELVYDVHDARPDDADEGTQVEREEPSVDV